MCSDVEGGEDFVCETDSDVMMHVLFYKVRHFSDLCLYSKPHKFCILGQNLLMISGTLVSKYKGSNTI